LDGEASEKTKIEMIYIIGHIKPDLDSAVSAVALKYLFDKADCFKRKNSQAVLAGPANHETKIVFNKFKTPLPLVLKPNQITDYDTFVLVDHNEKSQRLEGIKSEQITDIFDHHKIKLNLPTPIFINVKAWGSTATVISWFMDIVNLNPTKDLACLMISAILSDTQGFKSSTTTERDKAAVEKLNKIAQIKNLDQLIFEVFRAKSNLEGLTNKQILTKDYKLYDFSNKKVLINQVETVEQETLISQSVQLIKELEELKREMELDYAVCVITDILKVNSKVIITQKEEKLLTKAFPSSKKVKQEVYDIGPLLSRKKEIAPAIEKAL
jgi:manganese-dependent inorganic pyrophosphatase